MKKNNNTCRSWMSDILAVPCVLTVLSAVGQGIYLHGSVGSGKTMVMDLACAVMRELQLVPKLRRVHFSRAFDELHQRMHRCRACPCM